MARVYLASPLGFTEAGRFFLRSKLIPLLQNAGHTVIDPWSTSTDLAEKLRLAMSNQDLTQLKGILRSINTEICQRNEMGLRECDVLVAVLDGQEVDSGVAAEVGFGYALGKKIIGYRGDFRMSGDNLGASVNLQIDGWIGLSGGEIVSSLDQLTEVVRALRPPRPNRGIISQTVVSK